MTGTGRFSTPGQAFFAVALLVWPAAAALAGAQETVRVSVPTVVGFAVADVSQSTDGSPDSTRIAFSDVTLANGHALRLSVKADTDTFVGPDGPGIPASKVSWTSLGASAGLGMSGTLSASAYGLVFQSDPSPGSPYVDVGWTLAAPGGGVRAGFHDLTIRWKIEAITP